MPRFMTALAGALLIAGTALIGQAQAPAPARTGTEKITPHTQATAKNLMQDVVTAGCIWLWRPAPDDPKRMPSDRQPGIAGVYLLTPLASNPASANDQPTYLLTPSATLNFSQHVGHTVEITGTAQTAPLPPTVQEIATAPRPENKSSTDGMPRLTATAMKMVAESCP